MASLEGMQFNWAEYVVSRMHNELSLKRALVKVLALLCSDYVSEAIKYQLKQPIRKEKKIPKETERGVGSETQDAPIHDVPEEDPCQSKGKDKVSDPISKELPSKIRDPNSKVKLIVSAL